VRVIAGTLGGRQFRSPASHRSHPMGDKVRGALFSALGDIGGMSILDAYAGSGALSLEAASRGAGSVLAIDNDQRAVRCVRENVQALGVSGAIRVTQAPVYTWSRNNPERLFDIVLADPPYDDIHPQHISQLALHLRAGGLLVLSWPSTQQLPELGAMELVRDKSYAQARLAFYRHHEI
jgi:16S rRNA (guanine966-N2)-methyltransferase